MDLYNSVENGALTDELVDLVDRWPDCNKERAIDLQIAFDQFAEQGGYASQQDQEHKPHYCAIMYEIKRQGGERLEHFWQAHDIVKTEANLRRGTKSV